LSICKVLYPETRARAWTSARRPSIGAVFSRGKQAGIKHCFVEHDAARDPFASIAASFAYLKDLRF
jgi:hypothetical protein